MTDTDVKLADALSERYLAYAMSTIMSRSLPDVRDGLKPVHRRLIYAMQQLRLDPASGFKKCARIVGDVMGKFHPHGDASIYEAMVRLAQEFAVRFPLVEGQGNFGNIDGDNPAAMRYTEARLTEVAQALLAGIAENAVDFRPTYDGAEEEPVVLPAGFPNLLANGAAGIAVGMATSIPPHNAGEVCAAALRLIENPQASTAELLTLMPGPDFPTGGVMIEEPASIAQAYETGRGGFRLRARWVVEQGRFATWSIVVTEIPYQVQKAKLIEQIAALMEEKKLPLLGDIRDESTEQVRLVLDPKSRGIEPEVLMETLFRATALETRFPLNMNVLTADRVPRVLGLREVLRAWLDHRHEVLIRRTEHRLEAIGRRLEILEGFLAVFLNLDEVIRIIREEDDAKAGLMRAFSLTENQAEAILNMRLRSLRRLEEIEIRKEHKTLSKEQKDLQTLMKSDALRWKKIAADIAEVRAKFSGEAEAKGVDWTEMQADAAGRPLGLRRTKIAGAPAPVDITSMIAVEREPITVILSEKGWIRAVKTHIADADAQKFKEGDKLRAFLHCETTDRLAVFASDLPRGRGDGQPIRVMIDLENNDEIVAFFVWRDAGRYLVAGSAGRGFLVKAADLVAEKRNGKQVLNLREGERAMLCLPADGDHVAVVGENRKLLVFPLDQLPELGRGMGVQLQKYQQGGMADIRVFRLQDGLSWPSGSRTRTETDLREWLGERAQAGRLPPAGFPRSGKFTG
jgi:topoisomerase-4 subunit A